MRELHGSNQVAASTNALSSHPTKERKGDEIFTSAAESTVLNDFFPYIDEN
jgi:hypothetical protein